LSGAHARLRETPSTCASSAVPATQRSKNGSSGADNVNGGRETAVDARDAVP
jgi:hypothetical protein